MRYNLTIDAHNSHGSKFMEHRVEIQFLTPKAVCQQTNLSRTSLDRLVAEDRFRLFEANLP